MSLRILSWSIEMPMNDRKSESNLSLQQILELLSRPQKEERRSAPDTPAAKSVDKRPSREVVLKVIEGLKQV